MDEPTPDLETAIQKWESTSLAKKILHAFNPIEDYQLRARAARDIVEARKNPDGDTAEKINWKIESYRKKCAAWAQSKGHRTI